VTEVATSKPEFSISATIFSPAERCHKTNTTNKELFCYIIKTIDYATIFPPTNVTGVYYKISKASINVLCSFEVIQNK
jgi:hypothetical protein